MTLRSAAGVLVLAAIGCGAGGPALHPVRGQVLVNGQPAPGATVVFQPVAPDGLTSSGKVGDDGRFSLATAPHGSGAAVGEYLVLVSWYPADARSSDNPKNKLPARYADSTKAALPRVTVKAGTNDLQPLQLTLK